MNYPQDNIVNKGHAYHLTWIKASTLENYSPITQVYGVCFDDNGNILIGRSSETSQWQIAGGTPEKGETIVQTLKRELFEEIDVEVKDIKVLGVQKVEIPNEQNKTHYQVRCVCKIKKLLPQTPDPANGKTWERKFIPASEVTKHVKWGKTGESMFRDAIELNRS